MRLFSAAFFACAMSFTTVAASAAPESDDPYIWLEEFTSPRVMSWIEAHNSKTVAELEADPRYQSYFADALAIAEAKDRIPSAQFIGGQIYNFWQDADHVRGIWRRTSVASFSSANPQWETVLDLDALAAAEKANWVWKGASCARPAERRCLLHLSDGGEDAVTVREFDLPTGKFVGNGFILPKGKQRIAWEDENTLLISREWAPGDLGRTGYPFIVKRLKRGQPLSTATEVYRGSPEDGGYGVTPSVLRDGANRTVAVVTRPLDTFNSETYILGAKGAQRVVMPAKSDLTDMVDGRVIMHNREKWTVAGKTFPAGSVLAVDAAALRADPAHLKPTLVYAPAAREALQEEAATKNELLVSILDNVRGRVMRFRPGPNGTWTRTAMQMPENSTVSITDTSESDDRALLAVTNFITPPSQWLVDAASGSAEKLRQQPPKFDASKLVVDQREAVSSDGTRVPYFLVHRRDIKLDGSNPTLLYAYGGFEVSQTPSYSAGTGKLWLEKGGVYAIANIRGGGEFGPAWHDAGLGTKRQIVYDDFAAVARDLISSKVTSARRLGIRGGSNGGLLTGVSFTQHPELWNAVIIDVPLLDMIRISKIAAGASWEGEYGSVTDPAVHAFWEKTSPYHNLRKGVKYPTPFIFTTTKDDRVGPQHARKFAARMEEMGLPFYFYENTEGGHSAGANLKQSARTQALEMVYLTRKLMDPQEPAGSK